MTILTALKAAQTLHDVAHLFNITPAQFAYTLYKLTPEQKYETFEIPKKGGGVRTIHAPRGKIKELQRRLADILYDCLDELQNAQPRKPLSHGFRKSLSIITNAQRHHNRRYVLNLDLEDFFPTFNFGRVRGFFIKDKSFELSEKVATILAQIACRDGALPQGSPCSPIISEMIGHILDVRLAGFAKKHKVTYSRYADDLTFSTNQKAFPAALATGGTAPDDPWLLGASLVKEIERAKFTINHAKTRMQVQASRQMVTGLTVNAKVNVPKNYWRGIRSMCHALYRTGCYHRPFTTQAEKEKAPELITSLLPLAGMLSHVQHVKRKSRVSPGKGLQFGHKDQDDFWFYYYFVALQRPLIVTEGKTDSVYLRNAITHLPTFQPALGQKTADGFEYRVGFFNYENQAHNLVRLTGGIGQLAAFMAGYKSRLKRYAHKPFAAPVIILIDNDSALSADLTNSLAKHFGVTVNLTTKADFYHLTDNLYLVKTPEVGPKGVSCIEDLFDAATLALPLGGKVFHPEGKGFDTAKHIGKAPFAKKVIGPAAGSISWAGFSPLLGRIEAVLKHYTPPTPAAPTYTTP